MSATVTIIVLWLPFALTHLLLSSRVIRPRLIARLGAARFRGVYSLVALVCFVPLVSYYMDHRHAGPLLWSIPGTGAVVLLLLLVNMIGIVLLVAGVMTRGPASAAGGASRDHPVGVHRITRHAVFMGMCIWALTHTIANGYAGDVAFFGGFVVFVFIGAWHQDQRLRADGGAQFERFYAATAFIPFTGKGALRGLTELSPIAVAAGVIIALIARYLHPSVGF